MKGTIYQKVPTASLSVCLSWTDGAAGPWSQHLLSGLCRSFSLPGPVEFRMILLFILLENLYILFISHLLGLSPAQLPNFLCCAAPGMPLPHLYVPSGAQLQCHLLKRPHVLPNPPMVALHLQLFSVISHSFFFTGEVVRIGSCLLVNAFLSPWNAGS